MSIRWLIFLLAILSLPCDANAATPTSPLPRELGVILTDPTGYGRFDKLRVTPCVLPRFLLRY